MNQEKKYRRSRLRDLSEFVSANLSLSVSPCVQSASESPLLPRNCFPFISRDPGPSMAHKSEFFSAPVLEKKTSLHHGEGGYAAVYPRLLESTSLVRCSVGPPRCCEALHRSVESLSAAYLRFLLHFVVSSLLWVFFFYYSASFFTPISSCAVKHYMMGD